MKRPNLTAFIFTVIILAISIPVNIFFAKIGHPQSRWIVCDLFGATSICEEEKK